MTVAELGRRMSSREESEWRAFFQLEAEAALAATLPGKAAAGAEAMAARARARRR